MNQKAVSCVEPAGGPVKSSQAQTPNEGKLQLTEKEEQMAQARVGYEAPDFEANAFVDGGFKKIKLSDYKGQWVVVCFYPGDFTFV